MTTWVGAIAVAIGILMIAQWTVALRRGRVPELTTRPAEIRLHLLAEGVTALALIVGGTLCLIGAAGGPPLLLFALGMLTYTAIVSPGYFVDRGERGPVVMFAVIVGIALASAVWLVLEAAG